MYHGNFSSSESDCSMKTNLQTHTLDKNSHADTYLQNTECQRKK